MRGTFRLLIFALLVTVALAAPGGGQGGPGNNPGNNNRGNITNQAGGQYWDEAPDLPSYEAGSVVNIIVQFKHTPSAMDLRNIQQYWDSSDKNSDIDDRQHGRNRHDFTSSIKAFHLKVPAWAVNLIAAMPDVAYVSPDRPVQRSLDIVDATVAATTAWNYGYTGTGVGVAVIDSGMYVDSDLNNAQGQSRVVYSQTFVTGTTTNDDYGHGTHVAGIIGSNGIDSIGPNFTRTFKGVAPGSNLINLKVLDANGMGYESDVIAAIQQAIQLKNTYNIRVINLSLGRPVFESYTLDPLCQAVEAAWNAGIVVVVAAGNSGRTNSQGIAGYGTIQSPGNDPYVITVGATDTNGTPYRWDDSVASYSSKGPTLIDHIVKPDLVAPGNKVVSLLAPNCTLAQLYPSTLISDSYYENGVLGMSQNYFRLSGTSMATPVVAGAAALLIQKTPSLTPDQVKARLMKTAGKLLPLFSAVKSVLTGQPFSLQDDVFTVGAGYLDINAALTSNDLATLPAISPTAMVDPATGKIVIVRNFSIAWGDSIIWGDAALYGTSAFAGSLTNGLSIIWGDSIVWGEATTTGYVIIWGDTVNASSQVAAMAADDGDQ